MKFHSRFLISTFLTFLLMITAGCGDGFRADTPVSPDSGEFVYNNNGNPGEKCVDCHGADGAGIFGMGVDIRSKTGAQIETAVRTGPASMPAFSNSVISDRELIALKAFVLTL